MTNKKYFIAIVLPEPFQNEIEEIKHWLYSEYGLKGALRSPAHITLHRPFEWKEEKENVLIEKLNAFNFDAQFKLDLKDFDFFEPRVVFVNVLQNQALTELHSRLRSYAQKELKLLNEINDLRGFHPHVTVAFRDLKKPLFFELQKQFRQKQFQASFNYTNFSLLKLNKSWEAIYDFGKS